MKILKTIHHLYKLKGCIISQFLYPKGLNKNLFFGARVYKKTVMILVIALPDVLRNRSLYSANPDKQPEI